MDELRQKITFRKVVGCLMSMAIIAFVVIFQLIIADFNLNAFKEPDFYIRIVYRLLLIFLTYQAVVNLLFDRQLNAQKVKDARTKYIAAVKIKDISFKDFLEEFNRNLKKEAWIDKINRKINKITRKLEEGKKVEANTKKIAQLEILKTDEYIEANWHYLSCKWSPVFVGDFSIEDSISNNCKRTRSEFNKDLSRLSFRKMATYFLCSLALGMVAINLSFDPANTVEFWFNMIADILIVIMRAGEAGLQVPSLIDYNFTNVYLYKVDILSQYVEWCERNKLNESKAHKILDYIEENEVKKEIKEE